MIYIYWRVIKMIEEKYNKEIGKERIEFYKFMSNKFNDDIGDLFYFIDMGENKNIDILMNYFYKLFEDDKMKEKKIKNIFLNVFDINKNKNLRKKIKIID